MQKRLVFTDIKRMPSPKNFIEDQTQGKSLSAD